MRTPSLFDNDEFQRGFIAFWESEQSQKYLHPFLAELIDRHRTSLETADDAKQWQARLKAVRYIKDQADIQKEARLARLSESKVDPDSTGEQH
jgi:hypothetical protein